MKKLFVLSATALTVLGFAACGDSNNEDTAMTDSTTVVTDGTAMTDAATTTTTTTESYVDLTTGNPVHRDQASGRYVSDNDNTPVEYYVNVSTRDTFYGETGQNTNNAMIHDNSGKWSYDKTKIEVQRDGDIKMKDGDTKVKIDNDGDMKMKDENGKTKIDADDGEVKSTR